MQIGPELNRALREFATVERNILAAANQASGYDAGALVRARKDLVLAFATLGRALEHDPKLASTREQLSEATRRFAAFRTQNSINQADWPAIRARDNLAAYRQSSSLVAEKSRAFWQWVERETDFRK
jgi:hypothetical protein